MNEAYASDYASNTSDYGSDDTSDCELDNILDEIFPLTGSCTGGSFITKLWTQPCKECFWCHEKKWAFGKY